MIIVLSTQDMATDLTRAGASVLLLAVLLAVALAAASLVFLRAGLHARRRERRRERRRRAGQAASPPCAPSEADERVDAPAQARPASLPRSRPTRDISVAPRCRPARDASPHPARNHAAKLELLRFLKGLDAKFCLEQDDPEDDTVSQDWLRALRPKTKRVSRCDVTREQSINASHCLPYTPFGVSAARPGGKRRLLSKDIVAGEDATSLVPTGGSDAGTRPVLDFSCVFREARERRKVC